MTRARLFAFVYALGACSSSSAHDARPDTSRAPATAATVPPSSDDSIIQSSVPGAGGIEVYSASQLDRIATELSRASSTGRTIGGHQTFHYVVSRRINDGSPEIHDNWIDVTVVQSGRAALLTGGTVTGSTLAGAGEHRGGRIAGGTLRPIAAGDLFVIPAGVPHQFRVTAPDSIRYLTIKISK